MKDVPLSDHGIDQARQVGAMIGHLHFDRVISSPLIRARSTAKYVLDGSDYISLNSRMETDQRLEEQHFGIFEGLTYKEIEKEYPEDLRAWNADFENYRIPQGESFLDVRKRIDSFAEDLLQGKYGKGDGRILITAHKGTFGHLLASLLGLPASGFWNFVIDQGAYSRIDLEDGYAILRKLNSTEKEYDGREGGASMG